jgi:hypothetical protein
LGCVRDGLEWVGGVVELIGGVDVVEDEPPVDGIADGVDVLVELLVVPVPVEVVLSDEVEPEPAEVVCKTALSGVVVYCGRNGSLLWRRSSRLR